MRAEDHSERDEVGLTPAERELEAVLGSLVPTRASAVDPIAAAFEAGRRSRGGELRAWRAAAAAAAIALVLGTAVAWSTFDARRDSSGVRPVVAVVKPVETPSASAQTSRAVGVQSLLILHRAVTEGGLDALTAPPNAGHGVQSVRPEDLL